MLMFSFAVVSTDVPMIDTNENNHVDTNEDDPSPSHATIVPPLKVSSHQSFNITFSCSMQTMTTAEIRYRHSTPDKSVRPPIITARSEKYIYHLDKLYHWLIEQLKSSEHPMPINEVLTKYHEFVADDEQTNDSRKNLTLCRVRLRNRLENFYPNEFIFVVPNKRDGTYIALNDINHYLRSAIKKTQEDKEKFTKVISFFSLSNRAHLPFEYLDFNGIVDHRSTRSDR